MTKFANQLKGTSLNIMMLSLTKLFSTIPTTKGNPVRLVILGSSGAGKTTLVRYLETEKVVPEIPMSTIGIDYRSEPVKISNIEFSLIDIGGQTVYQQTFWSLGMNVADAVIYVFDGTIHPDKKVFSDNLKQFNYTLNLLAVEVPLLILINKQDLPNCLASETYANSLGLASLKGRSMVVLPSSAKYGKGLTNAFLWLSEKLTETKKH